MDASRMSRKNWVNILLLGLGFMLLFSAFQTTAFVQSTTINSFLSPECVNDDHSTDKPVVDGGISISQGFAEKIGYYSLCIIYLMVAIGNWASVSVVAIVGPKISLIVTGFLYVVYIAALIRPYVPVIFIGAFILGTAGGVLWTAQGQILIQNSSKERMGTTSGVFWFMLQLSLIIGNMFFFLFLYFNEEQDDKPDKYVNCNITPKQNYIIFGVLTVLAIVGVLFFFFLRSVSRRALSAVSAEDLNSGEAKPMLTEGTQAMTDSSVRMQSVFQQAINAIIKAIRILLTFDMLLLTLCFIYTGYELNFWSGVYGTVIGHTLFFSHYNIGLAGLFIGIGEIIGGGLFGILGSYTNRWGRDPVVFLGMITHFVTFLLVFYNLPDEAIRGNVAVDYSHGFLFDPSNIYVAMLCAFLLGFGDSCFNTQIYSIIGVLYPTDDQSAPAMALFKFFQSIAAMVGFLTSANVYLQWQLLVLAVLGAVGTVAFAIVEWRHYRIPSLVNEGKKRPITSSGNFSQ